MRILLLTPVFLIAACTAYNFDNSAFNEFLIGDYQSFIHHTFGEDLRSKRDTGNVEAPTQSQGETFRPACCEDDEIVNSKRGPEFEERRRECVAERNGNLSIAELHVDVFDCERMKKLKNEITCISECVSRKSGFVDDKGSLVRDNILVYIKTQMAESEWRVKMADEAVDKCIAASRLDENNSSSDEGDKCNPEALKFMHCIFNELFLNCPTDQQIKSPKCDHIRAKISEGKIDAYNGVLTHYKHQQIHRERFHAKDTGKA